jgi:hypothetical protein
MGDPHQVDQWVIHSIGEITKEIPLKIQLKLGLTVARHDDHKAWREVAEGKPCPHLLQY